MGRRIDSRLQLLKEWVLDGGRLAICGGYYTFADISAAAKYYRTAVEEILPVRIHTYDDRVAAPEGLSPRSCGPTTPS